MIVRERVREKEILREIRGYKSEQHEIPGGWGGGGEGIMWADSV